MARTAKNQTVIEDPRFEWALQWIIKEKMNDNKDYSSLDAFYKNFKNEVKQIKSYIDEKISSNS